MRRVTIETDKRMHGLAGLRAAVFGANHGIVSTASLVANLTLPDLNVEMPVRQWVISVPKLLRCFLADRPAVVRTLTKILINEIERLLLTAAGVPHDADAPSATRPRLGGISFPHRFGSANRSSRLRFHLREARLPNGPSSSRPMTTATSFKRRIDELQRSTSTASDRCRTPGTEAPEPVNWETVCAEARKTPSQGG